MMGRPLRCIYKKDIIGGGAFHMKCGSVGVLCFRSRCREE